MILKPSALLILVALSFGWAGAQLPKPEGIPLERFYRYPIINGRSPSAPAMSPDGSKIVFGWNKTGQRRLDLWVMDYPSGDKREILKAERIERFPRQDDERTEEEKKDEDRYDGGISGFDWSPDSKEILFSYRGRTWIIHPDGKGLRPLIDTPERVGSPQYSPDGKYIAFLRGTNLFRYERKTGQIRQLTFVSKAQTSVGGFTWAPDSKNLSVSWSSEAKLGSHSMMDFTKDRATVVPIRRMWHGELSVDAQVGVVGVDGGLIRWIAGIPRYHWGMSLTWSPDGSMLAYGWKSDDHQNYTLSVVPLSTFKKADVYKEKAPKNYIPDWRPVVWSRDGKFIYQGTDMWEGKFGFRSILKMSPSGNGLQKVYAEQHDVLAVSRPKESDRLLMVTAASSPLLSELTILEPDGKRKVVQPLPGGFTSSREFEGADGALYSDDGRNIAALASRDNLSAELYSIEPSVKRLTESQLPEFKTVRWADRREVTFTSHDGLTIHGTLITKPGLDVTKKHPAFISSVYANSAKQSWGGYFENYAAMELGMVVLKVDFRASHGYGGEFNSGYWKSMGVVDTEEAVAAKRFLVSLGYVREDRVGIWGWSYGGFLTCMALLTKPGEFHAGVAVASVTDWKSYNEWYTRERLGLAKDDPETYRKTSPINFASGLKDNLLLVHGMLDDNVLFQDTARLIQRLIEANKHFDVAIYPKDDHGIGKIESRHHVFVKIMSYLYEKLSEP